MKYYAIAIGGSGARCIEALVHLCAAGMLPKAELKVMFVDPDTSNGNLEKARQAINQYNSCRRVMGIKKGSTSDLFGTEITMASPEVWSPVAANGGEDDQTLNDIFEYEALKWKNGYNFTDLFEVLFSKAERATKLKEGFRGHPSIGAAVMANAMEMKSEEPWHSFFKELLGEVNTGEEARIFLFGSIFGGTGAAGLPTIPKIIMNRINNASNNKPKIQMGAAMLLPYFSFPANEDETVEAENELQARWELFLINTQAALHYYHDNSKYDDIYNSIYFIGEQELRKTKKFSLGANGQKNDPHFVEMLGALAAVDFFTKAQPTDQSAKSHYFVARQNENCIKWTDIPDGHDGELLRIKVGKLLKFSLMYLRYYFPQLEEIRQQGKSREAYYVEFFKRKNVSLDGEIQNGLTSIKEYCESFKTWLYNSFSGSLTCELINLNELSKGQELDSLNTIVIPPNGLANLPKSSPLEAEEIKKSLAKKTPIGSEGTHTGEFILALFDSCA